MNEKTNQDEHYMVSVGAPEEASQPVVFTFVPKDFGQDGPPDRARKPAPQFVVAVRREGDRTVFEWSGTPDDPGACRARIEAEAAARMNERAVWMDRVNRLVDTVEQWARELGWSTRRIAKKLDDARIGRHRVPALLMQEDTCRILLEPVARAAPGTEGVVDLYLMPAYDDIANLFFYQNQWNLHHVAPGAKAAATLYEAESTPLSKITLEKVIAELKQHAA